MYLDLSKTLNLRRKVMNIIKAIEDTTSACVNMENVVTLINRSEKKLDILQAIEKQYGHYKQAFLQRQAERPVDPEKKVTRPKTLRTWMKELIEKYNISEE